MKTYRKLDKLTPTFRKKVELFLKEVGNRIFITESWRSVRRQNHLYSLGRTRKGKKVTWTLKSNHMVGNAIDIAFRGKKLYPNDIYSWKEIAEIANKYGIDWGYDLWKTDKPHFQDNGKPLIEDEVYPKNMYGILVRLAKTNSTTLLGKANIKGYAPNVRRDEILIFNNTLKKGKNYINKVILHEFAHFIYHRYVKKEYFENINNEDLKLTKLEYWISISDNFNSYITDYASTSPGEDFAELIGYSYYINNKIELPKGVRFDTKVRFKYIIANNLFKHGLEKFKKNNI